MPLLYSQERWFRDATKEFGPRELKLKVDLNLKYLIIIVKSGCQIYNLVKIKILQFVSENISGKKFK